MKHSVLVIPAYNPDERLIDLVSTFKARCPQQECIVINDGSKSACDSIFKAIEAQGVTVLHHGENYGKGEALKTGMRYFLHHYAKDSIGIVTADADGQHTVSDMIKISEAMLNQPKHLHIGVRSTSTQNVPLRSRLGNKLTRILFNRMTNNQILDTQSGLRGIPVDLMKKMIQSKSSGYEFEFEMFFIAKKLNIPILQTAIQTIYINNNESSHFNPVVDSLKIYYVFLRFCGIAFLSFLVDFTLFCAIFNQTQNLEKSMIGARLISATLNFFLNKNITFKANNNMFLAAFKFSLLALFIGFSSYYLLQILILSGLNTYVSKISAESLLFLISFFVQYIFIFYKRRLSTLRSRLT